MLHVALRGVASRRCALRALLESSGLLPNYFVQVAKQLRGSLSRARGVVVITNQVLRPSDLALCTECLSLTQPHTQHTPHSSGGPIIPVSWPNVGHRVNNLILPIQQSRLLDLTIVIPVIIHHHHLHHVRRWYSGFVTSVISLFIVRDIKKVIVDRDYVTIFHLD